MTTRHEKIVLLRAAYNIAFAQLVRDARDLQGLLAADSSDAAAVSSAREKLLRAESAYRDCRDAVLAVMTGAPATRRTTFGHGGCGKQKH